MSDETKKAEQVFVVQMEEELLLRDVGAGEDPSGETVWRDIATVTIPANTPRRIALKQALKDAGFVPGTGPVKLRALDAKSAEVHEPEAVQPPMEWRL